MHSIVPILIDDWSRIVLERNENNYINASLIKVDSARRQYILTQVWCHVIDVNDMYYQLVTNNMFDSHYRVLWPKRVVTSG